MSRASAEGEWSQGLPIGEDQRPLMGAWSVRGPSGERAGCACARARHRDTGQAAELCVAVGASSELARRLAQAGELAARLVHPNLVRVFESGATESSRFAAVETRVGETLAQRVVAHGKMPLEEALRWLEECARGLAAAHNAGLIHGGIDPARIALVPKGEAKLDGLYLGLRREDRPAAAGSRGGADAAFAAPEQRAGGKAELSPAADLYALCACFVHAVTGKPLSVGKDGSVPRFDKLCPGAPERLIELVGRCLRRDAKERPADGSALLGALDGALRGGADEDDKLQAEWDEEMSWSSGDKKRAGRATATAGAAGAKSEKKQAKGARAAKGAPAATRARGAAAPASGGHASAGAGEDPLGDPAFADSLFGADEPELELPQVRAAARPSPMKRWIAVLIAAAVLLSVLLVALPSGRETMRAWFGSPKPPEAVPPRAESTERLFARAEAALADPLRLGQAEHLLGLVVAREPRYPGARAKLAGARLALARQSAEKGRAFDALRWCAQAIEAGLPAEELAQEREGWASGAREELLRALLLERCEWNRDASRVRLTGRIAHDGLRELVYGAASVPRGPDGRFDVELPVPSPSAALVLEGDHGVRATRALGNGLR